MFAREPFDMDYSADLVSSAKNARETLHALQAEQKAILARIALMDRDTDAGKYDGTVRSTRIAGAFVDLPRCRSGNSCRRR
jgi:hypothetical protein